MHTDVTKVRQALFNLLSNASKFTEHGTIGLTATRQRQADGDWISLAVSDTGIGMTREQLGRLFQPFMQADASTTRKFGGTGLGLALSRRFCEMLGGSLTVESQYGSGSTFTIRLPATPIQSRPASPSPADETPAMADRHPNTVLVVDDDTAVSETMRHFIEKEGFHVVIAIDGQQGEKFARALKPVAITLDVMLPGVDGWAVLATLKAEPELARIPVIVLSVLDQHQMARALGAAEYLIKPVDWDRLAAILHQVHQ
jgi:CheY-like chemotaxis protein